MPIIDVCFFLINAIWGLFNAILGVANIVIGAATRDNDEYEQGVVLLKFGAKQLLGAAYYFNSILDDILDTLPRLVAHSLASVGVGARKIIDATSEYMASSRP